MKPHSRSKQGLTLVEIMIALSLGVMAMGGILTVFISYLNHAESAALWREADNDASIVMERLIRGTSETTGLREFSDSITWTAAGGDWELTDTEQGCSFAYDASEQTISDADGTVFIDGIVKSSAVWTNGYFDITLAVAAAQGQLISTQEYNTIIQPRNP